MAITETDIEKLAALANLELTDEERHHLAPQIASIIAYVEQLNELETHGVDPVIGGFTPEGATTETHRDDVPHQSFGQERATSPAPDSHQGYFRVPKVI